MEENSEKILVRYYSDVLQEETVETLWTEVIDREKGLYKVDNIPFYGPEFSCDDIVYAEFDEYEERLTFRKVVEPSGNSTIQVVIIDGDTDIQKLRDEFMMFGCESEGTKGKYFVLNIPYEKNYKKIFEKLSELTEKGKIEFAEPVISHKHNAEK